METHKELEQEKAAQLLDEIRSAKSVISLIDEIFNDEFSKSHSLLRIYMYLVEAENEALFMYQDISKGEN